jgi:hypothetical protein
MSYPQNPDTIVIKNKFYPAGLTELEIWNYYQKVKRDLLKETFNRDLMVFIATDVNKNIIRRRMKSGRTIRMNPKNYENIITGRTISIHSAMGNIEEIGVIDVDVDERDGFRWAQKATAEVYDYVMNEMPVISSAQIRFTGKTSFHIVCNFGRKNRIDAIRFLLQKFLRNSDLSRRYSVAGRRALGVPNLDLSVNKIHGNYITLHSLSVIGLRCMNVSYNELMRFNPLKARIK